MVAAGRQTRCQPWLGCSMTPHVLLTSRFGYFRPLITCRALLTLHIAQISRIGAKPAEAGLRAAALKRAASPVAAEGRRQLPGCANV